MVDPRELRAAIKIATTFLLEEGYSKEEILSLVEEIQVAHEGQKEHGPNQPQIPVTGTSHIVIKEETVFDPNKNRVFFKGRTISLSPHESKLLHYFLRFQGEVLTYKDLAKGVIRDSEEHKYPVIVRVWIYRLRKKLAVIPNSDNWFKSVRSRGYYFSLE